MRLLDLCHETGELNYATGIEELNKKSRSFVAGMGTMNKKSKAVL